MARAAEDFDALNPPMGLFISLYAAEHVSRIARVPSSSSISSLLHSHVNLEWCDKIKLSNLLLPRKSGARVPLETRKVRILNIGWSFFWSRGPGILGGRDQTPEKGRSRVIFMEELVGQYAFF